MRGERAGREQKCVESAWFCVENVQKCEGQTSAGFTKDRV